MVQSKFVDILIRSVAQDAVGPHRGFNHPFTSTDSRPPFFWYHSLPQQGIGAFALQEKATADLHVTLIGELYTYGSHRRRTGAGPMHEALWRDIQGKTFSPQDLNGHFLLFIQNKATQTLQVITSRLGTYHGYYSTVGEQGAVGTHFQSVVEASKHRTLDWFGLTNFFANGFFPTDHTYFEHIKSFSPASVYTFDAQLRLIERGRYWDWGFAPNHQRTEPDFLEEFDHILNEVSQDLAGDGPIAMPISGGLDSRTMTAVFSTAEFLGHANITSKDIWSYSYGYTDHSAETRIAEKIAQARGLDFSKFVIQNYLFDQLPTIQDSVELFQYVDGTRQIDITPHLSAHTPYVMAAHWGDVWMDHMGITPDIRADDLDTLVKKTQKKIVKRGSSWLLAHIAAPQVNQPHAAIHTYYQEAFGRFDHIEEADFKVKAFKTDEWSHRWTLASIRAFQVGAFPRLPFYDNRIVDFFLTVPTHVVKERLFQIAYLKQYHPDLARIRWQEYDANLFWYKYFNNRNLAYRVFHKIKRELRREKPIQRNWEIFYLNPQGRAKLTQEVLQNEPLHAFVDPKVLSDFFETFYRNPDGANGYTMSMLLTFGLFLKTHC